MSTFIKRAGSISWKEFLTDSRDRHDCDDDDNNNSSGSIKWKMK